MSSSQSRDESGTLWPEPWASHVAMKIAEVSGELDRALAASARWDGLPVSVNLATANLAEPDLPARVLAALRRHRLPASTLTLEITETVALEDSTMADQVLLALDEAGVALSIDDFGTGHSSLARLGVMPVTQVKVDCSFVAAIDGGEARLARMAEAVVCVARALDLRTSAEGVETTAQLAHLRDVGCDMAQGYLFSKPLPLPAFADLMTADPRW